MMFVFPDVKTITTLAGFVPDKLVGRDVAPLENRPIEIGYRGRTLALLAWASGARKDLDRTASFGDGLTVQPPV